jgi:hypothetical protein
MNATPQPDFEEIIPTRLYERCRQGLGVQVIDVRSRGEFAGQRIAGAKSIPLGEIAVRLHELERERPIVVTCQTG